MSEVSMLSPELRLLHERRTIHFYRDESVPQTWVDEAVLAAHQAPNHKHTWPWRFNQIGPETKSKINELALKMKSTNGPLEGTALEIFHQKRTHPHLMVVSQVRSDDPMQSREDYAAVACAIHNFTLALSARGVGTKWSTGTMTRHPMAYDLSQVNAEEEEIVGFVWFGFAVRTPRPKRPEVSEIYRITP